MKHVCVESPFNPPPTAECAPWTRYGILIGNIKYARLALLDSLNRDESPFASHLTYTQVWSEDPEFRSRGIAAGMAQARHADMVVFYTDLGWSPGMLASVDVNRARGKDIEDRRLFSDMLSVAEVRDELEQIPWSDWPLVETLRVECVSELGWRP